MIREKAISVLSQCFAPVSREEWEAATNDDTWSDLLVFLDSETKLSARKDAVLEHLAAPLTFEEKMRFAARHFTGGLPDSALPVESLYLKPKSGSVGQAYLREPALYLRDLATALDLDIPTAFSAYPDHLSFELDMAVFLHAASPEDARDFVAHRFDWLPDYAAKLESINADASFYLAAVQALVCIIDAWREER